MSELAIQPGEKVGRSVRGALSTIWGRVAVWGLVFLWTIPTFGTLVSSFRPELSVKTTGWWKWFTNPEFTFKNYTTVLGSSGDGVDLGHFFLNSVRITVPAALMSVGIALFAAYAFSWMTFKGRDWLYVAVISLLMVPLQMALIPLLRLFTGGAHIGTVTIFPDLGLANSIPAVWIAHICFEVSGTRGQSWHLLTASGMVAMVVPIAVFFALQRYFVRGLLAGAVKG